MSEPILILSTPQDFRSQSDSECCDDCACPQPLTGQLPTFKDFDQPVVRTPGPRLALAKGWQVIYPRGGQAAVLNRSAQSLLKQFARPTTPRQVAQLPEQQLALEELLRLGLIEPDLPAPTDHKENAPQSVTAWLQMTDRCNLRCEYCYIKQSSRDLSLSTGKAIIDALIRSAKAHSITNLKLKYAGGEPMLRFGLLEQIHRYAQTCATAANIELQGVILSNGLLLNQSILGRIQSLGLSLMISLDELYGSSSVRRSPSGQTSTDLARCAVELALKHNVKPFVSITITRPTLRHLTKLTTWLAERNIPFNLNFYRQSGIKQSVDPLALDESAAPYILETYQMLSRQHPDQSLLNGILDRTDLAGSHQYTCGAGRNYLTFDTQGQVSTCQMLQKEAQSLDLDSCDLIDVVQKLADNGLNPPVREKHECSDCEWNSWCTGGCSLSAHTTSGNYATQTPHCALYRTLFPQILRMEAKRILASTVGFGSNHIATI